MHNTIMDIEAKVIDRKVIREHLAGINPVIYPDNERREYLLNKIKQLLKQKNAVIVAHYYVDDSLQELAEETGGLVSDSLEMAHFGNQHDASTLVVVGVKFMGETAKILNPEKTILMPTLEATCSLDLGCPVKEFSAFCDAHPDRTVVVYANTSAEVKARADWVVTSSIALDIVEHLDSQGKKILWAPDKHLGHYVQQKTGADMLLWDGACIVHEEFKTKGLKELKHLHPDAGVLAHPESPADVLAMADAVGSTSRLIQAAQDLPHKEFIVATDKGIFYKMKQGAPDKTFIPAPTAGKGATCRSCAHCPWMAMNSLELVASTLETNDNEIVIPQETIKRAAVSLQRMMDFRDLNFNKPAKPHKNHTD